jgi:caa(3)-type oxidase subunit IV
LHEAKISSRAFTAAWITLLLLTVTSFAVSFANLGALATPVALGIAMVKGSIVVLVFMELAVQRASSRLVIVTGVAMLLLLTSLLATDLVSRAHPPLRPPDELAGPNHPAG